ncbi:ATP-binding protein [Haloglomus salinum]|uniref:ATP-binding protein n=1 Tax=Haloglomus salinum TaxID=2962673 RepID=UPI0020CA228F|nr:AAA family ATPase [Haloglomus salinum]
MTFDAAEDALLRALGEHNPWWEPGGEAFDLPDRAKSDFYHLARPDGPGSQFEDQRLLGLVGRRGVGKTTLLKQFIAHRIEDGADPEQFCYVPFGADPLYQLQSDEGLRQAIRYYEGRILGRVEDPTPHFVFLDDVHLVEHPSKPKVEGWGTPVADMLDAAPGRHVVVTANAGVQIDRELERVDFPPDAAATQPILPEKFRDHCYTLYPELERGDTRVSPTPIREGDGSLPDALEAGDPGALAETLRSQYDRVSAVERRIQSQVVHYLAVGGVVGYATDGPVESAAELAPEAYTRLRDDVRDALYQDVPGFESVQTIADLERLCALAARNRGVEPVRYQRLVDLFDVDRRTITDSYLPALEQLYLLTGVTEYDNSRPRSVRLYLRDTGLVTALTDGDARGVLNDFGREAALARVAAFDHTMRFAYGLAAAQGTDADPEVTFWRGRSGEVDFVFEVDGTPLPIGLSYRPSGEDAAAAVREFVETYDTPFGIVLTGDSVGTVRPITVEDELVRLPYWFYLLLC